MKRHNPNDKRPRPHAIAPREHYVKKNGSWKPKMAFDNEASATNFLYARYNHPEDMVVYKCSICGKIHISTKIKDKQDGKED